MESVELLSAHFGRGYLQLRLHGLLEGTEPEVAVQNHYQGRADFRSAMQSLDGAVRGLHHWLDR